MFTHRWYAVSSMNTGMTVTQEVDQLIHALYLDTTDASTKTKLLAYRTRKMLAVLGLVNFLEALAPYFALPKAPNLPLSVISSHCLQVIAKINILMATHKDLLDAFEHRQRSHRLSEEHVASLKNKINVFTGLLFKKYYLFIATLLEPMTINAVDLYNDLSRIVHEDRVEGTVDPSYTPPLALYEGSTEYQAMRLAVEGLIASIQLNMPDIACSLSMQPRKDEANKY